MKRYKKIYIEITNICNLRCDFCPQTKRTPEFMSKIAFAKILDQIKPFADYVNLHVKGEPLLHPDLGCFLDICGEKGFKVNITTNGTLIDQVADMLIEKPALRQMNFSLHSFDGNQQEITKDAYSERILQFASRAVAESNMIISLRLWNLDETLLTECQRKRNSAIIQQIEEHFRLTDKIQGSFSETKALKLDDRIYLNQDYEFTWPDLREEEDSAQGYCFALKNQVAILVNGMVVPCCLDGEGVIHLGNIHEDNFADIVNGEKAETIRLGFAQHQVVEELCRKCGFRKRFNTKLCSPT